MASSAETLFARELENVTKQAFQRGLQKEEFWDTLAAFIGYAMGNAFENTREDLVEGVRVFGVSALTTALNRHGEIMQTDKVN